MVAPIKRSADSAAQALQPSRVPDGRPRRRLRRRGLRRAGQGARPAPQRSHRGSGRDYRIAPDRPSLRSARYRPGLPREGGGADACLPPGGNPLQRLLEREKPLPSQRRGQPPRGAGILFLPPAGPVALLAGAEASPRHRPVLGAARPPRARDGGYRPGDQARLGGAGLLQTASRGPARTAIPPDQVPHDGPRRRPAWSRADGA